MKNPRSVDNTVDNVDKCLWITHTVFVNTLYAFVPFTHGKPLVFADFLQDPLQEQECEALESSAACRMKTAAPCSGFQSPAAAKAGAYAYF
ncbi:hypothetical protein SDC9_201134 [bioreactor metagenome]|uniref:Uncharacterized protein n=1 Tax=bioreactor metagenome TaxID=1076179 RepID=A0A645IRA5_9ZZZZ